VIICEGILGVYGFDWFVEKTTCVHVGRGV